MSTVFDEDVLIHHISAPGLPGDGFTKPEAVALRNDLDTLLSRPTITELDDIPNVNASEPDDNNILVYDASEEAWVLRSALSGLALYTGGELRVSNANDIRASEGLGFAPSSTPGRAWLLPTYGGTGIANTFARSDHTHTNLLPVFYPTSGSGYISGSSRTVASRSVQLDAGIQYVIKATLRIQLRGADEGAAYYQVNVDINGNPKVSPGGASSGFWCVQGVPKEQTWVNARPVLGTGQSILVVASVIYHSGAGFNVDAGELEIEVVANR